MSHIRVSLEARTPLLLSTGLAVGNVQASRDYVAGSVLRGALAAAILDSLGQRQHVGRTFSQQEDPDFSQLFLGDDAAHFGFLYPIHTNGQDALGHDVLPAPLTAWTPRYESGESPRFDMLGSRLSLDSHAQIGLADALERRHGRLERLRGYLQRHAEDEQPAYPKVQVERRTFVRVGLNRYTETAQDRQLYALDAVEPGQKPLSFVGRWSMTDAQRETLERLLARAFWREGDGWLLRVGTARARGLGNVLLRIGEEASMLPLSQRLADFQRWSDSSQLVFALTLRSPLCLVARDGSLAQPTPDVLRDYVDVPPGLTWIPGATALEINSVGGWSGAWGLPKQMQPAYAAGGVLALRAPREQEAAVLRFLEAVEANGLGERRAEGWGEVVACDPFHVTFDARQAVGERRL